MISWICSECRVKSLKESFGGGNCENRHSLTLFKRYFFAILRHSRGCLNELPVHNMQRFWRNSNIIEIAINVQYTKMIKVGGDLSFFNRRTISKFTKPTENLRSSGLLRITSYTSLNTDYYRNNPANYIYKYAISSSSSSPTWHLQCVRAFRSPVDSTCGRALNVVLLARASQGAAVSHAVTPLGADFREQGLGLSVAAQTPCHIAAGRSPPADSFPSWTCRYTRRGWHFAAPDAGGSARE